MTSDRRRRFREGVRSGWVGGAVMALLLMFTEGARRGDVWLPLKLIGATVLGAPALSPREAVTAIVLGAAIHLLVSAILGVVFSLAIGHRFGRAATVALGGLYGMLVYTVMTYAVLREVNVFLLRQIDRGWFFLAHVAFGLTVGAALRSYARRRIGSRRRSPRLRETRRRLAYRY